MRIDLNCDLGEGFGVYKRDAAEEELMNYVSSVQIACGFHAGDAATMRRSVRTAIKKNIAIGAHPGLEDLIGFGRREMSITPDEARDLVTYQTGALYAFVKSEGAQLQHVKPHGALYNQAARDYRLARAIAEAVKSFDEDLILFVLANSESERAARDVNVRIAREAFADRSYNPDGSLVSRAQDDAVITDAERAAERAVQIVKDKQITAQSGNLISLEAETICIHGDTPNAVEIARRVSEALVEANVTVTNSVETSSR